MYPKFSLIKQVFEPAPAQNLEQTVREQLQEKGLLERIRSGDKVLITAGSRGVHGMVRVLKACIESIQDVGGEPFLCPAMGSHGSSDPQKQVEVLAHLGITEQSIGVPIYSEMHMVPVATVAGDQPVWVDQAAVDADHILLVNRIKEHTEYIGRTESGLMKMAVVGLGRQRGADVMHRLAVNISYEKAIHRIAEVLLDKLNILGGVAILENQLNQLRRIEVVPRSALAAREPELLEEAKGFKAKLPFAELDILLVDQIGKDISGAGMDTKVVGRIMNIYEKECASPRILRIIVRDLSAKTAGNAIGLGLADFTTTKAVRKIDFEALSVNCITARAPEKGRIPIALGSDRAALDAALNSIGIWNPDSVRMVWIRDTASLAWMGVSKALLGDLRDKRGIEQWGENFDLPFDDKGNLPDFMQVVEMQRGAQTPITPLGKQRR